MKKLNIPITKEREKLTELVKRSAQYWDFSQLNGDFKIDESMRSYVVENQYLRSTMDCVAYCFGRDYASTPDVMKGLYNAAQKEDVAKSTLVWYLQNGVPVHVGKLLPNYAVKSKWGRGHVLTHPIDVVPVEFGDSVEFSRDVPDYMLDALWSSNFNDLD